MLHVSYPRSRPTSPPPPPRPPRRSTGPAPESTRIPARRTRTFACEDDVWNRLEARARTLECSVDWLVRQALKRLLESVPPSESAKEKLPAPPAPLAPPRPLAATLVFLFGGKATPIVGDRFVLGRSGRSADLVLRDPAVSRQHAIVERRGGIHVLADMASANGVIVNRRRVARAVLQPGDVVEIGPFSLVVEAASG